MAITATLVRELRDKTGAAMMDCKKALEATSGDLEAAVDHLRKAGLKTAEKKASRDTGDGRVLAVIGDGNKAGSLIAVACETDFVAKTPDFGKMLEDLSAHVLAEGPADAEALYAQTMASGGTVEEYMKQVIGKLGENIRVASVGRLESPDGQVGSYIHHNDKVGVLVAVAGEVDDETLKDLCLHIAFHNPKGLAREDIPAEVLEREMGVWKESDQLKGKPENIQEKIIEGKLKSFYAASVLVEQPWVKDDKQSVAQALGKATVTSFLRFEIGA